MDEIQELSSLDEYFLFGPIRAHEKRYSLIGCILMKNIHNRLTLSYADSLLDCHELDMYDYSKTARLDFMRICNYSQTYISHFLYQALIINKDTALYVRYIVPEFFQYV